MPDLAGTTATRLQGQFNVVNEANDGSMNMPEQVYGIFPETMVFFDPAVPGADQVAADIAGRVGGTARAIGDIPEGATGLPDEATRPRGAITVVMSG